MPKKKTTTKEAAKEAAKPEKGLEITARLRRNWLKVRKAYNLSLEAFGATLSQLNDEEANELYDLIKYALYKDNIAQIIRDEPKLKEFVKTDNDRLCMHDIYENLSWRLGRSEKPPSYRQVIDKFRVAATGKMIP